MTLKTIFFLFLSAYFTQSCSLAPFSPTTSGKTLGKGNLQTSVGQANENIYIRADVGLAENFDFGFVTEFGGISTSAIFVKYAFINNPVGLAWNLESGYGSSGATSLYYFGSTASIAFSQTLEFFLNGRLNSVSTDEADLELGDYHGNLKVNEFELEYLQFTYGMNIWLGNSLGLSLYNTHFTGDDIETRQDATFGAAFLYKI